MRRVDYASLTERTCSMCQRVKPVSEFNRYDDAKQPTCGWRYYSQCRTCQNAAARKYGATDKPRRNARLQRWRKDNPEAAKAKERRARLMAKYGLTEAAHKKLMDHFGGMCWVCRCRAARVVDHDHATGKVRGVLCHGCNAVVVARVDENPAFIEHLREYLDECHADVLLGLRPAANRDGHPQQEVAGCGTPFGFP